MRLVAILLVAALVLSAAQQVLPAPPTIEQLVDSNRLPEARERLKADEAATGRTPRTRLLTAMILHREKRYAESLAELQEILGSEQRDARVYKLFGLNLVSLGREADAEDYFRAAVKLAPEDLSAQYYLGMSELALSRYVEAERIFRGLASRQPSSVEVLTMLGLSLEQQSKPEEAIELYGRAVDAATRARQPALQPRLYLGRYCQTLGRFRESVPAFEAVLAEQPGHAEAQRLLGRALLETGEPGKALPLLESAVARDPSDRSSRYLLARAYQRLGRDRDAQLQFQLVRETTPAPSRTR